MARKKNDEIIEEPGGGEVPIDPEPAPEPAPPGEPEPMPLPDPEPLPEEEVPIEEPIEPARYAPPPSPIMYQAGAVTGGALARISETIEPGAEEGGEDDLSDLFTVPTMDDPEQTIDDLVEIDVEDVFGEGGDDMSDLTDVTNDDIMGEDPLAPKKHRVPRRVTRPPTSPNGMQGVGY